MGGAGSGKENVLALWPIPENGDALLIDTKRTRDARAERALNNCISITNDKLES